MSPQLRMVTFGDEARGFDEGKRGGFNSAVVLQLQGVKQLMIDD